MEHPAEYGRLLQQAEAAWRGEDYESAGERFREAAALSPEDADAAFFAEAAAALADGAEYGRIALLTDPAERAIAQAALAHGSGAAYFAACRRIVSAMIEVASRHYEAVAAYLKKERKKHRRSPEEAAGAESLLADCANVAAAAAKRTAGAALERAEDLSAADEHFWNALLTLLDNAAAYRFAAELGGDPEIAALLDEIDRLRGNVFGEYAGVEELPEDEGEYVEAVCPSCGETLSFSPDELPDGRTAECPFCGSPVSL